MPIAISVRADLKKLQRDLSDLERKQLPYASARGLTALARRVQGAETAALPSVFDKPTPFTERAFGVIAARKTTQEAVVFAKDIQAAYLAPYEEGGRQVLGTKRGMLTPKTVGLNPYGNIPKGMLKRLKGRKDVFVGTVKFKKSGQSVSGVWQRPIRGERRHGGRGTKGKLSAKDAGTLTGLKLLVRFTDPLPISPRLGYRDRAERIVQQHYPEEMAKALAEAMRTARP